MVGCRKSHYAVLSVLTSFVLIVTSIYSAMTRLKKQTNHSVKFLTSHNKEEKIRIYPEPSCVFELMAVMVELPPLPSGGTHDQAVWGVCLVFFCMRTAILSQIQNFWHLSSGSQCTYVRDDISKIWLLPATSSCGSKSKRLEECRFYRSFTIP